MQCHLDIQTSLFSKMSTHKPSYIYLCFLASFRLLFLPNVCNFVVLFLVFHSPSYHRLLLFVISAVAAPES